jgi:hypothetical protein
MDSGNVEIIKNYLKRGWSAFPVQLSTKIENGVVKKDVSFPIQDGKESWKKFQTERITEDQIDFAWIVFEHVGIATGKISGITVVDVDTKDKVLPNNFPETYTVETKKGFHYYFKYNSNAKQTQNTSNNIDIRNDGGFVFAPPTRYKLPDGNFSEYKIIKDIPVSDFPIGWYQENFNQENNTWKEKLISPISVGERNMDFTSVIGGLLHRFPQDEWETIVWQTVQDKNKLQEKPLSLNELRSIFNSISNREKQSRNKGGIIKDIKTEYSEDNEELRIDIVLEQTIICFKIKNIISTLSEANTICWINKATGLSYEMPFYLKTHSDSNKEQWVRILSKAFDKKDDKEVYPWTIITAKVSDEVERFVKSKKQDFLATEITPEEPEWLIEPFIQKNQINTIFGMGSSGKTLMSLFFSKMACFNLGINTLFVDFEDTAGSWKNKLSKIESFTEINVDLNKFIYFNSEQIPVAEQVEKLKEVVRKHKIDLVIIDSASLATGDSTSDEKAAVRLVSALKLLRTTCLIIAHQRKNDGDRTPIGSIQYENQSRNVWNVKGNPDESNNSIIHIAMSHTKANNTYLRREPVGYCIEYTPTAIRITQESAQNYFEDKYTVLQRIEKFLKDNTEAGLDEIVESLNISKASIAKNLTTGKSRGVLKNEEGKWKLNI